MEIDIAKIFRILLQGWKWIVATVVVFLAATFVYTQFFATPMYKSTSVIYIRPGESGTTTMTAVNVARDMVPTYRALIDSDQVMNNVKQSLEDPARGELPHYRYTVSQLRAMKSVTAVEDTEVVKITVTCADPHDAQLIADQIVASAEPTITGAIKASAFDIIDFANLPGKPSSPNLKKNLVIALLAALVVSCGVLILVELLDRRIKDQRTLTETLSVPVLGVIPSMD